MKQRSHERRRQRVRPVGDRQGDVVFIPAGTPHWYQAKEGDEPFEFLCVVPNGEDKIELVEDC